MKRKNDDLLRLAFGELSPDTAESVEAQAAVDPAARMELEAYRSLRAGLQQLPPPPPDGLSTERLRAAILDRELKTRRPSFVPLAWAPVALAAVAAVVFLARPAPQGDPSIVAELTPKYDSIIKKPDFTTPAVAVGPKKGGVVPPPMENLAIASRPVENEAEVRPAASRRRDRTRRVAPPTMRVVFGPGPKDEADEKPVPFAMTNPQPEITPPPSSIVSPNGDGRIATNSDDTVVIISTQRDLETGARAASETEAGSVLVGG